MSERERKNSNYRFECERERENLIANVALVYHPSPSTEFMAAGLINKTRKWRWLHLNNYKCGREEWFWWRIRVVLCLNNSAIKRYECRSVYELLSLSSCCIHEHRHVHTASPQNTNPGHRSTPWYLIWTTMCTCTCTFPLSHTVFIACISVFDECMYSLTCT